MFKKLFGTMLEVIGISVMAAEKELSNLVDSIKKAEYYIQKEELKIQELEKKLIEVNGLIRVKEDGIKTIDNNISNKEQDFIKYYQLKLDNEVKAANKISDNVDIDAIKRSILQSSDMIKIQEDLKIAVSNLKIRRNELENARVEFVSALTMLEESLITSKKIINDNKQAIEILKTKQETLEAKSQSIRLTEGLDNSGRKNSSSAMINQIVLEQSHQSGMIDATAKYSGKKGGIEFKQMLKIEEGKNMSSTNEYIDNLLTSNTTNMITN